jgi:plastocyanin
LEKELIMLTPSPNSSARHGRRRSVVAARLLRGGYRFAPTLGTFAICGLLFASTGRAAQNTEVQIRDFAFEPQSLSVAIGSEVTWVNDDEEPHLVVNPAGGFKSEPLDTGDRFSFRFNKSGTYKYFCSLHPHMIGTIIVGQGGEESKDSAK